LEIEKQERAGALRLVVPRPAPGCEALLTERAGTTSPLPPLRKGGKTAQRNRDERAACVSPSFEQPSPAKAVVRESKVENRKLVWWDWRGWIALAWVLWWGWAYAVMAWQAKAPQVLAWLEAIKSGR